MLRRCLIAIAGLLLWAGSAQAATVTVAGSELRVVAAPGEYNAVRVAPTPMGGLSVEDRGAELQPGSGCLPLDEGEVTCDAAGSVDVATGDGDDSIELFTALPSRVDAGSGSDRVLGGPGPDRIVVRDSSLDSVWCGDGRDSVRAEVLDSLDFGCEQVDYGSPGRMGRLRPLSRPRRFVRIPGQPWAKVDRRILADVLYLVRRYKVRVIAGFALRGHSRSGEHPLGLATDLIPGPGGSWRLVGKLARLAEPRQDRPRPPWRWVGYNGDPNHGDPRHCRMSRGCPPHLHLSWDHTPGRPGRPVKSVWVFGVRTSP